MNDPTAPTFWRDPALPFLEARAIEDGRGICYAKHSHETFSIGLVTGGESLYLNGRTRHRVRAGTVVVMNPGDVHACSPLGAEPWAYRMFHVDPAWLGAVQREGGGAFQPYATMVSESPALCAGLEALYRACIDPDTGVLAQQVAAVDFFGALHRTLLPAQKPGAPAHRQLQRAAEFIDANCMRALKLEDIAAAADLSPSYLVRAFKERHGITPHAYLVDRRIQYCRAQLRRGHSIADVALAAGFADQAHLQRAFKQHVAATPGQYRASRAPARR